MNHKADILPACKRDDSMTAISRWQYDEFRQVGKNYGAPEEVDVYDSTHADFRDAVAEADAILDLLGTRPGDRIIEIGTGTGTFAIQAARRGAQVYAIDVSPAMIAQARAKAAKAGVTPIEFIHAGFLTYEHTDTPADAVVTSLALHHLPDFWKGVALRRVNRMLKDGGLFYLYDVVVEDARALERIAAFIDKQAAAGGDFLRDDAETHFREEYSTYDWIMEGLLTRAGFEIKKRRMTDGLLGAYLCVKKTGALA